MNISEDFYSEYLTMKYEHYNSVILIRFKDCFEAYEDDVPRIAFPTKRKPFRNEDDSLYMCFPVSELDWVKQRVIRSGHPVIIMDYG